MTKSTTEEAVDYVLIEHVGARGTCRNISQTILNPYPGTLRLT